MRASFKTLLAAVLIFGSAAAIQPSTVSAQTGERDYYFSSPRHRAAQYYGNRYYGNRYYGGYRRAYFGPRYYGYRHAYYPRRYGYYGPRYGYYRYPYRHYYRRGYGGGAVVAGLIGGLTLGALANPYYGYGPAYYRPAYYGPRCVIERRRVINRYGHYVRRRVEVCY
ncbi:hypothetical protein [Microvirga sp. G4-2]|uniref:hypothetical protein n=1 Tax=Microvirga sp. G4-2 TaxID=3434467 RepID=UPI004043C3BE